ncbi:unnamed protein product [Oikopleura dioica]|uniref:Uncharacterized protein n=1 Tax=Oikopleura dioica TaxID=34765 RepID=E4XWG6_OIKDI|nr:unnamed protein product [Oikopleura dioica]
MLSKNKLVSREILVCLGKSVLHRVWSPSSSYAAHFR